MSLGSAHAAIYTVTSATDTGDPGTLRWAITQADANPGSTINIQDNLGTITFLSQTPIISAAVTINGGIGNTVSGNNANRIFFVDTPNATDAVVISNLTLAHGLGEGGDGGLGGGGGGLGAGGAIFVNRGAVTVSGVQFLGNSVVGGAGGSGMTSSSPSYGGGGGGGLGGNGGNGAGGAAGGGGGYGGDGGAANGGTGGGGGLVGDGGFGSSAGSGGGGGGLTNGGNASGATGGAGGGGGGVGRSENPDTVAQNGLLYGGGGGGGSYPPGAGSTIISNGGNGGKFGGGGGAGVEASGGNGGDFGGGGGKYADTGHAGNGGFGGGGGGSSGSPSLGSAAAGAGGFGGGGGGANASFLTGGGGILGGSGGSVDQNNQVGGGGGGGAAGGAIFVRSDNGATLTLADSGISGGNATGGAAGFTNFEDGWPLSFYKASTAGKAAGSGIFLDGGNVTLQISGTETISDSIGDAAFTGGLAAGITKTGGGTLVLSGNNNYAGLTVIQAGTLSLSGTNTLNGGMELDGGILEIAGSAALGSSGTISFAGGTLRYSANADDSSRFSQADNQPYRIDTNGRNITLAANLATGGSGSLTKVGAGTLTLSGASTFGGALSPNEGTLNITGSVTTGGVTGVGTSAGLTGTLNVTGAGANWTSTVDTLYGLNGGTGNLVISGGGTASDTFALVGRLSGGTGNVTVTGAGSTWTHSAGLVIGTGGVGTMLVSAGGEVSNADGTIGGDPGSSGAVTVTGLNSNWTSNSYLIVGGSGTGALSVADSAIVKVGPTGTGTLTLANAGAGAGTLNIGAAVGQAAVAPGTLQAATVTSGSGSGPTLVNFNHTGTSYTFAPALTGSLAVQQNGSGRTILSGTNTYTGPTVINAGTLQFATPASLSGGLAANLTVASGGTAAFNVGGAGEFTTSDIAAANALGIFQAGASLGVDISNAPGGVFSYGGMIVDSSAGALGFMKAGGGTLSLTGTNTYTGPTTLAGGTLIAGNANAFGSNGTISFAGGTLQYSAANPTDYSSRFSQAAGQQYRIDTNGIDTALAGDLASSGGTFAKLGAGTLTLSGNDTFSGALAISGGVLQVGNGSTGSIAAGSITNSGALVFNRSGAQTFAGPISGAGPLSKLGAGTLTLSGSNTYTGATTVSAGAVQFTTRASLYNAATASWNVANLIVDSGAAAIFNVGGVGQFTSSDIATLAALGTADGGFRSGGAIGFDTTNAAGGVFTYANAIVDPNGGANSLGLIKQGSGVLTLTGNNTYTGGTTVSGGTLSLGTGNVLPVQETVTVNGGTLDLGANHSVVALGALTLTGGAVTGSGTSALTTSDFSGTGGTVNLSSLTSTQSDDTTFSGVLNSTQLILSGTGTLTLAGTGDNGGATATVNSGTLVLAKGGTAGITHAIGNGLTINSGGTVRIAGTTGDQIYPAAQVMVNAGGVLDLNGRSESLGVFTGQGTATNTAAGTTSTLTVGEFDGTFTFAGTAQDGAGTLALAKTGAGTLTLTGNNTYTGGTTINFGTLALGASERLADTGALTISGGTFDLGIFDETVGAVTLSSGNITGGGTLTGASFAAQAGTISTPLAGGSLAKTGSGTVTFTGSNSYIGGTTISGGTVAFGPLGSLPVTGAVTVSGGTFNLGTNHSATIGALTVTSGSVTGSGSSTLTTSGLGGSGGTVSLLSLTSMQSGDTTFAGILSATQVILSGSGTLTLGGSGDNSGATATVNSGTLVLAKDGAPGVTHAIGNGLTINSGGTVRIAGTTGDQIYFNAPIVVNTGGAFDLNGRSESLGSFTGGGTVTNTAAGTASTLTLGEDGSSSIFSGTMQDGAGTLALVKIVGGTLTLTGSNTYTGGTTINGGTLALGANETLADTGALNINGATFNLGSFNETVGAVTLSSGNIVGSGTLTGASFAVQSGTISAPLAGGTLTKTGSGTVTLTGSNTYSGGTMINGGTLMLTGADSSTGGTTINGGTLALGSTGSLADTEAVTLSGGTFNLGNDHIETIGALSVTSGSVTGGGVSALTTSSFGGAGGTVSLRSLTSTQSGDTTFSGVLSSTQLILSGIGTLTLAGTADNVGAAATVNSGTLVLAKDGPPGLTRAIGNGLTINSGGTVRIAGTSGDQIVDAAPVVLNAGGTLDLNGRNESLGTIAGEGTVTNAAVGTASILALGANGGTYTFPGSMRDGAGTLALAKTGGGTLTLTGSNTFTGGTTINAGTLALGASERLADTGALTVNGGTFDLGNFNETVGAVTLSSGDITGSGTLSSASFLVQSGTISAPLAGGTLTISGGTLDLGNFNETVGAVTLSSGNITGNGTLSGTSYTVRSGTISASLAGGPLTKTGSGGVTLTGTNTYTGGTTISGGTLALVNAGSLGGGLVEFSGGTLQYSGANSADYSAQFSQAVSEQYQVDTNGHDVTFSTGLASAGGTLTKLGGGTLTLAVDNSYTGGTTIGSGTLALGASGSLSDVGAVTVNGGTLDLGANHSVVALGALTLTGGAVTGSGTSALTTSDFSGTGGTVNLSSLTSTQSDDTTFSGVLNSTQLILSGTGTLTLAGTGDDGGATATVNSGTLVLAKGGTAGITHAIGNGLTINSGGTVRIAGTTGDQIYPAAQVMVNAGGVLDLNGRSESLGVFTGQGTATNTAAGTTSTLTVGEFDGTFTFAGTAQDGAGTLALAKTGAGTLTLTGNNTYTGGTTINFGTLALGAANSLPATGAVTVSGGTFNLGADHGATIGAFTVASGNVTGSGSSALTTSSFAGTGGTVSLKSLTSTQSGATSFTGILSATQVILSGSGTLTLGGSGDNSGATATVNSGTLVLAKDGTPGVTHAIGNGLTINDGGTVRIAGATGDQIFWAAPVIVNSGGMLDLNGRSESLGVFTGGGTVSNLASGTASTITLGENNSGDFTFSGTMQDGAGTLALVKIGGGTLTLTGSNTFTGGTTISSNTLSIGDGGTAGSIVGDIANNAALVFNRSDASAYAGAITGSGTLTKTGGGALTLTGNSTYAGATGINGGTLVVDGSIAGSSMTTINNGGTLGGHGTVGPVTIAAGGTISPGNSPGTMNTGSEAWDSGASYVWELNDGAGMAGAASGNGWDFLNVDGALTINSTSADPFVIDVTSLTLSNHAGLAAGLLWGTSYDFTIATADGGITGFSPDKFLIDSSAFFNGTAHGSFVISQSGNSLVMSFTAVPEPAGYGAIVGFALCGLVLLRWHRPPLRK